MSDLAPTSSFLDKCAYYEDDYLRSDPNVVPAPVWKFSQDDGTFELPRLDGRGIEDSFPAEPATEELIAGGAAIQRVVVESGMLVYRVRRTSGRYVLIRISV